MCDFIVTPMLAALGAGGATAAGATATAATAGASLAQLGTYLSIGGSLYQGIAANRAAKENVALIEQQKKTEAQLTAVKEQREVARFKSAIAKQAAELAGRGVQLDSPTAVFLGCAGNVLPGPSDPFRRRGHPSRTDWPAAGLQRTRQDGPAEGWFVRRRQLA